MLFAERADVTFLFPLEVGETVETNPLYGYYSKEKAVAKLLSDSGLLVRQA